MEGAVNTVARKACLASPRLLEGLFGRKWSSESGAQLNGAALRNIQNRVGEAQPPVRWDFSLLCKYSLYLNQTSFQSVEAKSTATDFFFP